MSIPVAARVLPDEIQDLVEAPVPGGTMRVRTNHRTFKKPHFLLIACTVTVITSMLSAGCGLHTPEAPNWTIDLLVPIANRHIDGPYIASHAGSKYLTWTDDSGLVWTISADLDTVHIGNRIKTTPPSASRLFPLGSIVVGEDAELSCRIDLEDVTPLTAGTVPELTTSLSAPFHQAADFDSLSGATGLLRLEIENELGVTVDQVTVTLFANGSQPLASFAVPGTIPSGSSQSVTHEISNLSFGDDWTATLAFHTPGGTVLSAADKFISVLATFPEGVTARYARAVVGATSRLYADTLVLSDTHILSGATIGSGELFLSWTNNTPLPLTLVWESNDLTLSGSPLSGQATIAAESSSALSIDLAGVQYASGGALSSALVRVGLQSNGSNGQTVEVSASQTVGYTLSWSEVGFSAATGQIGETQFSTGALTASVDWEDGLEIAGLDAWDAYLVVSSSLPLTAQITGEVTTNTGLHLPFNGTVAGSMSSPTQTRFLLQHDGAPLLPLPEEIRFEGAVRIGGGSASVSIDASNYVSASVQLSAPAHMYVDGVSLNIEPASVSLSGEDFGDRTNRLINAVVTITVANRFPMGGQFTLRMAADSAGVDSPEALVFGPSTLSPAVTDGSGNAVSATTTQLTYTLDSNDLALFEREVIWFAESLTLLGPGQGQPARISPVDVLDWNAQARIEYRVDGDVRPWEN